MESNISRDHIAMEAMTILLNKTTELNTTIIDKIKSLFVADYSNVNCFDPEMIAKEAYSIADAMIAEREKEK